MLGALAADVCKRRWLRAAAVLTRSALHPPRASMFVGLCCRRFQEAFCLRVLFKQIMNVWLLRKKSVFKVRI